MLEGDYLKQAFKTLIDSTGSSVRGLFSDNSGFCAFNASDYEYVRRLSALNSRELRNELHELTSLRFDLNRRLESNLASADRDVQPCIDSVDLVLTSGLQRINSSLKGFELTQGSLSGLHLLREEKLTLNVFSERAQVIQDFLDTALVMDECITRSHFAQAWSVYEFAQRLLRKSSHRELQLFVRLQYDLEKAKLQLVTAIEEELSRKPLKVQEANNLLLTYRMIFPTVDLKEKFAEWRGCFYRSRKHEIIKGGNPTRMMKDLLEHGRINLSDIVGQFKTIFNQPSGVLTRLVIAEVEELFGMLESQMAVISQESVFQYLTDIYSIAAYMKLFDVHPRLNRISHTFLKTHITKVRTDALVSFKLELSTYNWKPFTSLIPDGEPDTLKLIFLTRNKPVAVFYNDVTMLLNEIRAFPLVSIMPVLVGALDQLLRSCIDLLCAYPSAPSTELSTSLRSMCLILTPTVEKNISSIFDREVRLFEARSHPRFLQDFPVKIAPVVHADEAGSPEVNDLIMERLGDNNLDGRISPDPDTLNMNA